MPSVWHRPTVRAAARLDEEALAALEAALRAADSSMNGSTAEPR